MRSLCTAAILLTTLASAGEPAAVLHEAPNATGMGPTGSAQWGEPEQLTLEEWEEARAFATRFTERLHETRDVTPLVPEFFVSDFTDHLRYLLSERRDGIIVNNHALFLFHVRPALVAELSDDDLLRYFNQAVNFWYLTMLLRTSTQEEPFPGRDETLESMVHREVTSLLNSDPILDEIADKHFVALVSFDPPRSGKKTVRTADELRHATVTLEGAANLMRQHADDARPETTERYEQNIRSLEGLADEFAAQGPTVWRWATTCGDQCGLLPAGTRFIEIFMPPILHVHFLRVNGKLKIFYIDLPTD